MKILLYYNIIFVVFLSVQLFNPMPYGLYNLAAE